MSRLTFPLLLAGGLMLAAPAAHAQGSGQSEVQKVSGSTGAAAQTDWTGAKKQPQIVNPDPQTGKPKDGPAHDATASPPTDTPGPAGTEDTEVREETKKQ